MPKLPSSRDGHVKINRVGRRVSRTIGLTLSIATLLAATAILSGQALSPAPSSDLPTVTYRRVFEGSTPEFVEIAVRQDGAARADVRQLSEPAAPQDFIVGSTVRGQIFDLARDLRNFQGAGLDARRRVAYLGLKTFRWDKGSETYQTQYNYTIDPKATQLQKVFDNLAQEQADLAMLEEKLRYDRLGVNDALGRFEEHLNQRILPEPGRFLSVLDRIAADNRLIELARQRARTLATRIRAAEGR